MVISHSFHKAITIQYFPVQGKKVYLHIKRRRWLDKKTKTVVQRDWDLVARGTFMTIEFAAFLKVLISTKANNCHIIGGFYGVNSKKLQR